MAQYLAYTHTFMEQRKVFRDTQYDSLNNDISLSAPEKEEKKISKKSPESRFDSFFRVIKYLGEDQLHLSRRTTTLEPISQAF